MTGKHRAGQWLGHFRDWDAEGAPPIDFQMHTTWTDGQSSVAEMIAAARAGGLQAIAITEHVNSQSDWYARFVAEVMAQREGVSGLEVFYGVEVAASDYRGGLKADLANHEAELVLGVVHRCPKETGGFWSFDELTASDAIELELRALAGLAGNRKIDGAAMLHRACHVRRNRCLSSIRVVEGVQVARWCSTCVSDLVMIGFMPSVKRM